MTANDFGARYWDPEWMRREVRSLWPRVWFPVAAEVELADEEGFVATGLGPLPVFVLRDGAKLRAFHNVCSHRGHLVCTGSGTLRSLVCPYHHWRFDRSGRLVERPDAGDFEGTGRDLTPLRCTTFAGLVWVCADPATAELSDWLGDAAEALEAQGLARMSLTSDVRVPLSCNWKLSVEVHCEGYHVHALHPEVLNWVDDTRVDVQALGLHGAMQIPLARPSPRGEADPHAVHARLRELLGTSADVGELSAEAARTRLAEAEHAALDADGVDVGWLPAERLVENHFLQLFPAVQLNGYGSRVMLFRHQPDPMDPARTVFRQQIFELSAQPPACRATPREVSLEDPAVGNVTGADLALAQRLQAGVASPAFARPEWSRQELLLRRFHAAVEDHLSET